MDTSYQRPAASDREANAIVVMLGVKVRSSLRERPPPVKEPASSSDTAHSIPAPAATPRQPPSVSYEFRTDKCVNQLPLVGGAIKVRHDTTVIPQRRGLAMAKAQGDRVTWSYAVMVSSAGVVLCIVACGQSLSAGLLHPAAIARTAV